MLYYALNEDTLQSLENGHNMSYLCPKLYKDLGGIGHGTTGGEED